MTLQAEHRPGELAVVCDSQALTYADLERVSNRLARLLRESGCRKGDRVCLLLPKRPEAIAAILAIYKAGCIYVPLDPSSPAARLTKIINACSSRFILAGARIAEWLQSECAWELAPSEIAIGWMEADQPALPHLHPAFTLSDLDSASPEPLDQLTRRGDPAHILFTSGSTGIPKGVIITHDNVIQFIEWAVRYFDIAPDDRNAGHPPLSFDLSFLDIFGTFAAGAELHPVPTEINVDPANIAQFIRDRELTQWFSVPSVLHYMAKFDVLGWNDFPRLKRVLWCGEVLPTSTLIYWMKRLPHVQFTNLYGPTETTIASSYYTVPECPHDQLAEIPIGTACDGEELLILDDNLQAVPAGVTGRLYIRGAGLSQGYWNDPEATARAFVPDPFSSDPSERIYNTGDLARRGGDGLVYFLGRNDSQIKSRGYRIELGEIEAALNSLAEVRESAVVALNGGENDTALICCAYVPAAGIHLSPAALRKALSRLVPNYMLPVRWRVLDLLPKNGSGKIDRRALKEEFSRYETSATVCGSPAPRELKMSD